MPEFPKPGSHKRPEYPRLPQVVIPRPTRPHGRARPEEIEICAECWERKSECTCDWLVPMGARALPILEGEIISESA